MLLKSVSFQQFREIQVSKWLDCPMLIDHQEMQSLFEELGEFLLFSILGAHPQGSGQISKEEFIDLYTAYIRQLSEDVMDETIYRYYFTSLLTVSPECAIALNVASQKHIIKPCLPVIMIKPHRMEYSKELHRFQSGSLTAQGISWGLQFSFPQLFEDPTTGQVERVYLNDKFSNSRLFHTLQKWVRRNTVPTPFLIQGKRLNATARMGKQCFSWIHTHKGLISRGIQVDPLKI